jgi:hypothetical protein
MARNPNFELRNRIVEKYRTQADFSQEAGIPELKPKMSDL